MIVPNQPTSINLSTPAMHVGELSHPRPWIKWLLDHFIPMKSKHTTNSDQPGQEKDKTQMAWRTFVTAGLGYIATILTMKTGLLTNPPETDASLASIDKRLTRLEQKVDNLSDRFVDLFMKNFRIPKF